MQRRPAGHEVTVLNDEEIAAGVRGEHLKSERAVPQRVRCTEPVLARGNDVNFGSGRSSGRLRVSRARAERTSWARDEIVERSGGQNGCGGREEVAALHWHAVDGIARRAPMGTKN